jgi:hypothetical protein
VDDYYSLMPYQGNEQKYKNLVSQWWNWVYKPDRDTNYKFEDVTFLRDDIVGTQLKHDVGISSNPNSNERVWGSDPNPVNVEHGKSIFFPVYHVCSVKQHPFVKGGTCSDLSRCTEATQIDLANCYDRWARIGVDNPPRNEITTKWDDYYVQTELKLEVPGPNDLKREAGFYLDGKESPYDGVAAGTYLLLNNFEGGNYYLDFGGRATDFRTRSLYKISVK